MSQSSLSKKNFQSLMTACLMSRNGTGGVNGDVATLDWVRDRFAHTVEPADMTRIDTHLEVLREAVVDVDL